MCGKHPKLIALIGTNASGKSSLGIELAKVFNGEIISADSRQIYKGFDLCCGKVTAKEAKIVPHHLLNIKEIGEDFSVSDYQEMAYSLIDEILQRNKIPFIVGGTGLYVNSVVYGYNLPKEPSNKDLRERLEQRTISELRAMLTPDGKTYLDANPSDSKNKRRIIRVIEKSMYGEPLNYENSARYDVLKLGTMWCKDAIHKRIEERLETRIAQGMIDEIRSYLDNGGNPNFLYDLGLEYRYILWHLTGKFQSIDQFKLEMARAIKHFAKRQIAWFKRDKSIHWIDMSADYLEKSKLFIRNFLAEIET